MKLQSLFLAISLFLFATACTAELEKKIASLEEEKQSLVEEKENKQQELDEFLATFEDIQANLAEIKTKEKNIEINNAEESTTKDAKSAILEDIQAINQLVTDNKSKVEKLNKQIARAERSNSKLTRSLKALKTQLTAQIEEKDMEIASLKEELKVMSYDVAELNIDLDNLKAQNADQAEIIEAKTNKNNTAFYAVTTTKELLKNKVVSKKGGVLGLGRTKVINGGVSEEIFSKIDITKVMSLPINSKKVDVISNHPADSYTFEMKDKANIESLVILDPERFWSNSKYLVVSAD